MIKNKPAAGVIAKITKHSVINDRIAFQRRLTNLETYIQNQVNPVEEEVLLIREKLIPLYDTVRAMRDDAKQHCTHPEEYLNDISEPDADTTTVVCTFCESTFHIPKQ